MDVRAPILTFGMRNHLLTISRSHYTLGKCLWKMFCSEDSLRTSSKRVELQEVIDALLSAINALPQRRDSRSDPIFEPHFKLFSVVHKAVLRGHMTVSITLNLVELLIDNPRSLPKEPRHSKRSHGPAKSMPLKTWRGGILIYSKSSRSSEVQTSPTGIIA